MSVTLEGSINCRGGVGWVMYRWGGMGHVGVGWVGHVEVGCIMQGWGGVGHVGVGWVGHVEVGWGGSCRGGIGWVM